MPCHVRRNQLQSCFHLHPLQDGSDALHVDGSWIRATEDQIPPRGEVHHQRLLCDVQHTEVRRNEDHSLLREDHVPKQPQQGGLPRAVGPGDGHQLALRDRDIDILEDGIVAHAFDPDRNQIRLVHGLFCGGLRLCLNLGLFQLTRHGLVDGRLGIESVPDPLRLVPPLSIYCLPRPEIRWLVEEDGQVHHRVVELRELQDDGVTLFELFADVFHDAHGGKEGAQA
mmetsp:Transcript_52744/g.123790  ORF Transcript_52744/g.123790 Transcript_52744/m.123790 type:complete len:226 (-) Transcript_52744:619-1296(-)